jgi:hypothetical protein
MQEKATDEIQRHHNDASKKEKREHSVAFVPPYLLDEC